MDGAGLLLSSEAWLSRGLAHAGAGDLSAALEAVVHAMDTSTTPQVTRSLYLAYIWFQDRD